MIVADTSVIVAAIAEWHVFHDLANAALPRVAVAHTLMEAYSVLTRLPEPQRALPTAVAEVLRARFDRAISLPPRDALALPSVLARSGVAGGSAYDAVIALTAVAHRASLLTLDQRALTVYERCGAEVRLIGS